MDTRVNLLACASLVMAASLMSGCVYDAGGYNHNPLWGASSAADHRGHTRHQQAANSRSARRRNRPDHSPGHEKRQRPQPIDNGPIIRPAPNPRSGSRQAGLRGSSSSPQPRIIGPVDQGHTRTNKRPKRPEKAKAPIRKTPIKTHTRESSSPKSKTPRRPKKASHQPQQSKQPRVIKRVKQSQTPVKLEKKPIQAVRPVTPNPDVKDKTMQRKTMNRVQSQKLRRVQPKQLRVVQ